MPEAFANGDPQLRPGKFSPKDAAQEPLILALTADLFLVPRFEDAGRALGFQVKSIARPSELGAEGAAADRDIPLTEPLEGADARLVRRLTELRPALILIDLTADQLPWERWVQTLKTSAATRRIPILAFGPHVDDEQLERARLAGADEVVTRGQLHASLAELIKTWARPVDLEAIAHACAGELSELAKKGMQFHNEGKYYEAHEALEHAWMEVPGPDGYLYRALLQTSVAYLHIQRENYRGAAKMLLRIRQWLDPLPDVCRGVDVAALRENVRELRAALDSLGPEGMSSIDRNLLRPFPMRDA